MNDRAFDFERVVRDVLANGPCPAADFRKIVNERGVPVKLIAKVCRAVGAVCRRNGPPGKGGWEWVIEDTVDRNIRTHKGRKGYYADNLYRHGREIQEKLGDDLDTARKRLAELRKELEAERAARPMPTRPAKVVKSLPEQIRDLAKQLLLLARTLEQKGKQP